MDIFFHHQQGFKPLRCIACVVRDPVRVILLLSVADMCLCKEHHMEYIKHETNDNKTYITVCCIQHIVKHSKELGVHVMESVSLHFYFEILIFGIYRI